MTRGMVVLAGRIPVENLVLDALAAEFQWSCKEVDSFRGLAELKVRHDIIAVLFSPKNLNLPWDQALRATIHAAPGALPILCHGFAEAIDWPQAARAGAFHSLLLPFSLREVRQSLGFASSAKSRSGKIPMRSQNEVLLTHAHAAGSAG